MTPVYQTRTGIPDGNCFAACVASIFDLTLSDVPDPHWPVDLSIVGVRTREETTEQRAARQGMFAVWEAWRLDRGLSALEINLVQNPDAYLPTGYVIGTVKNTRDGHHAVVCLDGRIVHDPYPVARWRNLHASIQSVIYFTLADPVLAAQAAVSGWRVPELLPCR